MLFFLENWWCLFFRHESRSPFVPAWVVQVSAITKVNGPETESMLQMKRWPTLTYPEDNLLNSLKVFITHNLVLAWKWSTKRFRSVLSYKSFFKLKTYRPMNPFFPKKGHSYSCFGQNMHDHICFFFFLISQNVLLFRECVKDDSQIYHLNFRFYL